MLTVPSFKKSLIVEQFQRNYLKKLRRLLQRKRHVNIKLFVRLSVFTIIPCLSRFTKQAKCTFVCLVRMVFTRRQRTKNLSLLACDVVRTSNMKISRRPLADYVKKNNRAARVARFLLQCFDVVCQTTT